MRAAGGPSSECGGGGVDDTAVGGVRGAETTEVDTAVHAAGVEDGGGKGTSSAITVVYAVFVSDAASLDIL